MRFSITVALAVLLGVTAIDIPPQSVPTRIVSTKGPLFVDELGRSRIFHGTNVVYKGAPWHPDISPEALPRWSFNQDDIDILASHGVTAIRLGIMWPGVEPVRGQYNYTYLEVMKTIVQRCSDAGIYVLLDFHQDGLSEKFCGEGVPLWAAQPAHSPLNLLGFPVPIEARPYKLQENGVPTPEDCGKHYYDKLQFSYAAGTAYQRLYDNYDGLRDSFANYWKLVAQTFLPFKNILGYDLINEPWAGNVVSNPGLLVPGVADRMNLQNFYDVIATAIRSVDPNAMIFFESVTWDNFVVGFTHAPGGTQYASKSVLSFHHYQPPQLFNLNATFVERSLDMLRLQSGGMLTEFEMGWKNGGNIEYIRDVSRLADKYFFSYTGWEYTDYIPITGTNNGIRDPETGLVRPDMAEVYSRTYATAIAGIPLSMSFDDKTGLFTLTFVSDGTIHPTEIRVNSPRHYPSGYSAAVQSASAGFRVLQPNEGAKDGFIHVVREQPGRPGAKVTVTVSRT
ncbi:uncharacterized protein SPPG_01613 [Spizellomyces punctatus DAOM BR117]|uniref:Glycoside hydrolase family 5 domain-containing protein n=1 Tax=Spizellomyces punctatus (strain DAOM BR117) TaxID=645134 RepID=A0A0L0HTF9_SPIPD|nr:uncharacterized protein SPPG_01613 [Spizellomyces punctatus DAOM BR117]KND04180.1 hypothetical protein SPPG_01613 [Spizellomyces punctatus DAOM BR117]|eukprot:XP_016612219.1 hypothetical protein SPPG_01613 [Spizellomyces punctatus DAOM BR117]